MIKRYLKLYKSYLALAFKTAIAYRADAIIGIIGFLISNIINFYILKLMISPISQFTIISNNTTMVWDINMLMFLYGFILIPKGIDHMLSDDLWNLAGQYVKQGELDRFLTKPVNPLFQLVAGTFKIDGLGEVILGILFMSIFGVNIDIIWNVNNIIPLILSGFLSIFIFFSIKLFTASLAFFFKRSLAFMSSIYSLNEYAKYPLQLYGKVISSILLFVIPFSLGCFLPIQFLIFGGNMWILLSIIFGVTSLLLLIALLAFKIGLSKYESSGS